MEGDKRVNWLYGDFFLQSQIIAILVILGILALALTEIKLDVGYIVIAAMIPIYAIMSALVARSRVWIAFWSGSLFGAVVYFVMTTFA